MSNTICAAFQATVAAQPDRVALRTPDDSIRITWAEYDAGVRSVARGLAALGIERGDTVALMLRNRPEFNIVDLAILHLGATPFSIYNTSPVEQMVHLLGNAGSTVIVTEEAFLDRVLVACDLVDLRQVVSVDSKRDGVMSLAQVEALESDLDVDAAWQATSPDDLLTIIYTSGTTGPAKGVELTHASLLSVFDAWKEVVPLGPEDRVLSYLPSAHGVDRLLTHYQAVCHGIEITTLDDVSGLAAALQATRPTFFIGVPRVWEKFQAALEAGITQLDEGQRTAVLDAIEVGRRKVRAEQAALSGEGPGPDQELLDTYASVDEVALVQLRARIGMDQIRMAGAGAAPASPAMLEFFAAIGLPIHEGWGMTELSGVTTTNPRGAAKFGTVGKILRNVELKVAEDGELLVRGPSVMRGYRNAPEKTAEAIDAEGWMHTGDIGTVDEDGYVRIVDRKKELIINAAGKNMSPANIEASIKSSSPLIGQCVAVGDQRPYNVALIVLDPDAAGAYARSRGLEDHSVASLAQVPDVQAAVAEAISAANEKLARIEQIKRHVILTTDWLPDSDELTPTMKLKRRPIAEKYATQIDALYGPQEA